MIHTSGMDDMEVDRLTKMHGHVQNKAIANSLVVVGDELNNCCIRRGGLKGMHDRQKRILQKEQL